MKPYKISFPDIWISSDGTYRRKFTEEQIQIQRCIGELLKMAGFSGAGIPCIINSWGDGLNDEEVLDTLKEALEKIEFTQTVKYTYREKIKN